MTDEEAFQKIKRCLRDEAEIEGARETLEILTELQRKFDWAMTRASLTQSYRLMAKALAGLVKVDENATFLRCSGEIVCGACQLPFYDHPELSANTALRILCDGRTVHL